MRIGGGRYELREALGTGAMGIVWQARDRVLGIDVAIKTLRAELAGDPDAAERLLDEARICARMSSPHVVKVLAVVDADEADGGPFVVYEQLVGETLADRLDREGPLPLGVAEDIVCQIARALSRCHMLGIVHRDVKPENVFLVAEPNGRVLAKLIDFGIAYDPRTSKPVIAGTPEYMAPETLFARRAPDARIDVYALAVVAYECLTGHRPFAGDDIEAVRALVARDAPPVTDFRADLDVGVDVWMVRALHRNPSKRYQSAKELAHGLAAVAQPMPLAA